MHVQSDPIVAGGDGSPVGPTFTLALPELMLAGKAVKVARRAIDEIEFHTRLGADVASADSFLSALVTATSRFLDEEQVRRPTVAKLDRKGLESVVTLDRDELSLVNNALNEVLHGLREEESAEFGDEERAEARRLLRTVNTAIHDARSKARLAATNGKRATDPMP